MKIILACSSDYMAIPAALKLIGAGMLMCVVIPEQYKKRLLPSFVQAGINSEMVHAITKETLETGLTSLVEQHNADCVFVITFPWKIPATVLSIPINGFVNFHPGLVPKYKGADPIFWQLRNREVYGGFTIHRMTDEVDNGPVLMVQKMPVIPGETYGIHHGRLGTQAAEIVLQVAAKVAANEPGEAMSADETPLYFARPGRKDVTIDWERQTADEVEALVNATNPKYNGAFTSIRNMQLTILDVAFTEINNIPEGTPPGTIVYADALYGPIAVCADGKCLKINAICLPEGYISGSKFIGLGVGVGERFI